MLNIEVNLEISKKDQIVVEKATRFQSKSLDWQPMRSGRITAKNFKQACKTNILKPARSLIKGICYPSEKKNLQKQAAKYGNENEPIAGESFKNYMITRHTNFKLEICGLIISESTPALDTSPDGLTSCDCCGNGVLEVKCPFRLKNFSDEVFKNYLSSKDCPIISLGNNNYKFNHEHQYFFQIQLQLYATEIDFCDFLLWNKQNFFLQRIFKDQNYLDTYIQKALIFHKQIIIPELLARYYTHPYEVEMEHLELNSNNNEDESICYCKKRSYDEIIECSNFSCTIKLFHFDCIDIFEFLINDNGNFWPCVNCR